MREKYTSAEPGVVAPIGSDGDHECPYPKYVKLAVLATDLRRQTTFKPGSPEKQCLMYLRNVAGLPLHIEGDERDHTPTETRRELFEVSPDVDDVEGGD